ncbi:MAG: hypothetical protein MAGBODY4_00632 [Candidatus Marinimicrobia bacterium]|nr:hypothetical protein [Candidatus Neomarinimicrobiota bacterium]
MIHKELTEKIIKAFYEVYNMLGYGFPEKVYENALVLELRQAGLKTEQQKQIDVCYKKSPVGEYYADILVEDLVILEIKTSEALNENHSNQLINYLRATDKEVGLLLNFGEKPQMRRKIFTNDRK